MQAARASRRVATRAKRLRGLRAPWRSSVSRSLQVQKTDSIRCRIGARCGPVCGSVWRGGRATIAPRASTASANSRPHQGVRVGRKRVERLMHAQRLSGAVPRKRAKTTIRVAGVRAAEDLVGRDFVPSAPNQLWVADIKYIPTAAGWLYLAAVVDCFSRRVVGWSMRDDLRAQLVVDALEMAVTRRRPGPGLVHHSDQGTQYVSLLFGERCRAAEIEISIGCTSAYDNAVAESFFASLTKDLLRRRNLRSRAEARTAVFDYIETFYNPIRLHSTLDYRSPIDYEKMKEEEQAA